MLNSIYLQMKTMIDAATYLHEGSLSKFTPNEEIQSNHKLSQVAIYLLDDNTLLYSSDIKEGLDGKGLPKNEHIKKRIKNVIYHPHHGLLTAMVAAALAPMTVSFYIHVNPENELSKAFKGLTPQDVADVQLQLLFNACNNATAEFEHYCKQRNIQSELNNDEKLLLIRQVNKHLNSVLFVHEGDISKLFNDLTDESMQTSDEADIKKGKFRVICRYLKYVGQMLAKVGLHQACFIDMNQDALLENLSNLLKKDEAVFEKKIFNFNHLPSVDVLLAYQALNSVSVEDFTVKPELDIDKKMIMQEFDFNQFG